MATLGLSIPGRVLTETDRKKIEEQLLPIFRKRIDSIDPRETSSALKELNSFLDFWQARSEISTIWNDQMPAKSLLISAEKEASKVAAGKGSYKSKSTPNSVRNVEPTTLFRLVKALRKDEASENAQ